MAQVVITKGTRVGSNDVLIEGTVDGRSHSVYLSLADINAAVGKAAKVALAAAALKARDDQVQSNTFDLSATVEL